DIVFQTELSASWPSFLNHHRIYDVVILPSPAYIEMALKAAQKTFGDGLYSVVNFNIHEALVLSVEETRTVQMILTQEADGARFQVMALADDNETWKLHASGSLVRETFVSESDHF